MMYHNLDLEAFDYCVEGDMERFRVRVTDSPAGEQWHGDADQVIVSPDLRQRLQMLEEGMAGREAMIALGQDLAALLFPPGAREFLNLSRQHSIVDWFRLKITYKSRRAN